MTSTRKSLVLSFMLLVGVGVFSYNPRHVFAFSLTQLDASANSSVVMSSGGGTKQVLGSGSSDTIYSVTLKINLLQQSTTTASVAVWLTDVTTSSDFCSGISIPIPIGTPAGVYSVTLSGDTSLGYGNYCAALTSGYTLNASHSYSITMNRYYGYLSLNYVGSSSGSLSGCTSVTQSCSPLTAWFYSFNSVNGNFSTHIDSVTPYNGQVVATTSPNILGASGYVSSSDFVSGTFVRLMNDISQANSVTDSLASQEVKDIVLSSAGSFNVSTTSAYLPFQGRHNLYTVIMKPVSVLGVDLWATQLGLATSTSYTAGALNYGDSATDALTSILGSANSGVSSILQDMGTYCNVAVSFDLGKCLYALIVPTQAEIDSIFHDVYTGLLTKWPLGYITLPIAILDGQVATSTASLPSLTFTLPSNANLPGGVGGSVINLTPWSSLMGSGSYLYTATSSGSNPKTFRQIVEPNWNYFVYFSFGVVLLLEIIGLLGRVKTTSSSRKPTNEEVADYYSKKYDV